MEAVGEHEEFETVAQDSLLNLHLDDSSSSELWLIQLPLDQSPEFDGQELSLELEEDGELGSFEGLSGKLFSMVSDSSEVSDTTVFVSSSCGTSIAGKVSRQVSLVHHPEPDELIERETNQKRTGHESMTLLTHSSRDGPTTTRKTITNNRHSQSRSRSTNTSGTASKSQKRNKVEHSRLSDQSGLSDITLSQSPGQSPQKKARRTSDSET